ncbi:MAG: 16S rRNA (cytosine(1402)-N(4))-methyltransferase RsmH [Minwuia sp.]|nr:16S rRNA (cytosine(1402)-N(4))-methyltransferase RsmH [Minwuia sp.]
MTAPLLATRDGHVPVMGQAVANGLKLASGLIYLDCTYGLGGYTRHWLNSCDCKVIAIDRDPTAVAAARQDAEAYGGRLTVLEGCFGDMVALLGDAGFTAVDGIAMDLGVSSPQLDQAARGFSIQHDGPLDMRMGAGDLTADEIVNNWPVERLADIFYRFGEERKSRQIARAIDRTRADRPIRSTGELAAIVARAAPSKPGRIHPATRVFQAIRIVVNDELGELRRGLIGSEQMLRPGGRLAVVSFHSLEDRMVKRFLGPRGGFTPGGSRHRPAVAETQEPSFRLMSRGSIKADEAEIATNPRSRSARMRLAERLDAPAWPPHEGFEELAA